MGGNLPIPHLSWSDDGNLLVLKYDSVDKRLFKFSIDGVTTQLDLVQYDALIDEDIRGAVYSADGLSTILLYNNNKLATIRNTL